MSKEDVEFEATREDMMFVNNEKPPWVSLFGMCPSGALSEGAWKISNRLAIIR